MDFMMSKASNFIPKSIVPPSGESSSVSIDDTTVAIDKTWSSSKLSKTPDIISIVTNTNTYSLSGAPISPASSKVLLNGVELDYTSMFSISSNQITIIPSGLEFYLETGMILKVWWY